MAEGIRKKGSRLHRVCYSGQKLGAALPVCLPWEPSVVGTFCFLMDEAVCVCVSFTPMSSLVIASFLPPPNAVPIPGQTHKGHLQRTEPAGTIISVPTLWDRNKISSAQSRLLRPKDPVLGTWGLNHNGIGDIFPRTGDVARRGPLEGEDAVMLAWGPHFCE